MEKPIRITKAQLAALISGSLMVGCLENQPHTFEVEVLNDSGEYEKYEVTYRPGEVQ